MLIIPRSNYVIFTPLIFLSIIFITFTNAFAKSPKEELLSTIEVQLSVLPKPHPYQYSMESWDKIIAHTWAEMTSPILGTKDLRDAYDTFYLGSVEYAGMVEINLQRARRSASNGDLETARRLLENANRDRKLFNLNEQAAFKAYDNNLGAAKELAEGIYEGSKAAVLYGSSMVMGPAGCRVVDAVFDASDFSVETSENGLSSATRNLVSDKLTEMIFKHAHISSKTDKSIEEWIESKLGKTLFSSEIHNFISNVVSSPNFTDEFIIFINKSSAYAGKNIAKIQVKKIIDTFLQKNQIPDLTKCGSKYWQRLTLQYVEIVQSVSGGYSFDDVCQSHDNCYRDCTKSRDNCDKELLSKAKNVCENSGSKTTCINDANVFYNFVNKHGENPFNKARENCPIDTNKSQTTSLYIPICAEVVIDKSGSMNGEKYTKASVAVNSFIDRCKDSDYLGLTSFSNNATLVHPLISMQSNHNRQQVKENKQKVKCGGGTNIGSGLSIGFKDLQQCSNSMQKAIVLLSDGQNNSGDFRSIVEQIKRAGIPIYTISYGRNSGEATLQQIARETGGWYGSSETTNITAVYLKIAGLSKGESGLTAYNDTIEQNQTLTYATDIPSDFRAVTFTNSYQGSHVDLNLRSPSGEFITSKNYHQLKGVKYIEAPTYSFYTIENPESGRWTIELFGAQIPQKEQVNTLVSGSSPLMLNSYSSTSFYRRREHIPITVQAAELFSGKKNKPQKVELKAIVRKPSPSLFRNTQRTRQEYNRTLKNVLSGAVKGQNVGESVGNFLKKAFFSKNKNEGLNIEGTIEHALFGATTIELYDDGMHQDGVAGDNIYGGIYENADQDGPYSVEIHCIAETQGGERIERTIRESFQVGNILKNEFTLSDFLNLF